MKKKYIIIFCVLLLLSTSFLVSKFIWFNINEDAYFTQGRTYDGEIEYIKYQSEIRKINEDQNYNNYITENYLKLSLMLPYNSKSDSILSRKVKGALLSEVVSSETPKSLILNLDTNELSQQIKKELIDIDHSIDTTNTFTSYKTIYNYIPRKDLIMDSYESIKKDIRLSSLKALNHISGAEKKIYEFENKIFRGFQFCVPNKCKYVSVRLFDIKNNEWTLLFKNFTQDEIDFVLNSIKLKAKVDNVPN